MKIKMRTRILALLLSMAMVMNGGISALASEAVTTEPTAHVHTDECYTKTKVSEATICGKEVTEGHTHSDACYNIVKTDELICGSEESAGHTHDDGCYGTTDVLTCTTAEHEHSEGCYAEDNPCTEEEHTHDDSCYEEVRTDELICGSEESAGHAHDDSCYKTENQQICTLEECEAHIHDDSCYEWKEELTCTVQEVVPTAENAEDKTCENCKLSLEECTCEKEEPETCENCNLSLEECTCEKEEPVSCEKCELSLEECTCEKEEPVVCACGNEACECENCEEGCTCTPVEEVCACGNEACECENCEEGCTCEAEKVESLEYVDETIKVTVTALEEGAIPEGAILKVTPIEKKEVTDEMSEEEKIEVEEINAEYALTEEKLEEKMQDEEETEIAGFLVYDITFVTEDGTEIEPNGEVKVTLEYVNAVIPETVETGETEIKEVTVIHLEEDENGEVKNVVDMNENNQLEILNTTDKNAIETAEFTTGCFSKFVIVWTGTTISLEAVCVDSEESLLQIYEVDKEGNLVIDSNGNNVEVDIIRRVLADPSKSLSSLNIYIQGYEYKGAYIKTENGTLIEDNVEKVSYVEGAGWKYTDGDGNEESLLSTGTLYLQYSALTGTPASKINTIGIEDGITLNLYDYTSAVNTGKHFVFRGTSGDNEGSFSGSTYFTVDGFRQGILQSRLDDEGYPKLSYSDKTGTSTGVSVGTESLKYLFENGTGVTAYAGLSGLFRKTSDGWYVYDSQKNHAELNEDTNSIDVYNATLFPSYTTVPESIKIGGFLPFNTLPQGAIANENYCLSQGTTADYWFGLNLVADFEQPVNGQVKGSDMTFSFSGDDDMWVFIDNCLVLDIGGTHGRLAGSINFATGEVNVESKKGADAAYDNIYNPATADGTTPTTYIGEMYKAAGMDEEYLNAMFKYDSGKSVYTTFKDNTPHTMRVFYFERATSQSNCKIEFNIQPTNFGEVNVEKEITSPSIDLSKFDASVKTKEDVEFKFLAEYTAPGTSNVVKSGIPYVLINEDGSIASTENVTGVNGEFYLKDGQKAKFDKLRVDGTFKVTEVLVPQYGCDEVTVTTSGETPITNTKKFMKETVDGVTKEYYTTTENGKPDEKIEIEKITDNNLSSELVVVENEAHTVEFKNSADLKGHLVIRKDLRRYNETFGEATFVFKVDAKVDANTVYSDVVAISFTEPGVKEHRIDGLPAGAVVTVEEVYEGASYKKVGSYVIPDATEGTIVIPADCNVEADKAIEVVFGFINDYVDGRLNSGSGLVNEFIYKEDEQKWVSPQQVAALPNTELLGKKPEEDSGEIDS